METWDAIRARRNVRQYTDQPVAREDLERICEAGRRAASPDERVAMAGQVASAQT